MCWSSLPTPSIAPARRWETPSRSRPFASGVRASVSPRLNIISVFSGSPVHTDYFVPGCRAPARQRNPRCFAHRFETVNFLVWPQKPRTNYHSAVKIKINCVRRAVYLKYIHGETRPREWAPRSTGQVRNNREDDCMDRNRRYVRHLITPRLYVAMNGSRAGGILYDVSPGGLSLDVVGPKPPGDRVLLDFDMPETGEHFEGSGRIIWQKEPGNRVGIQFIDLPPSSHLKIKSWISARSISAGSLQNMVVPDRSDTTFMESPESLLERATFPAAAHVASPATSPLTASATSSRKPLSTSPVTPPVTSPVSSAVLERTANEKSSLAVPADVAVPLRPPPTGPPQQQSNTASPHVDERSVRELRSLFSSQTLAEPQPEFAERYEHNPPNWAHVRQWLLTAGVILFAVMFLATRIKIFSSQEFNAGVTYQAVKSKLAGAVAKLMESPASRTGREVARLQRECPACD